MTDPKILFRAPNWVGDAIMSTAILKELMDKYSKIYIGIRDYVSPIFKGFNKDMVLLTKDPFKNKNYLEKFGFDIAFLFTPSFSSALETFLSGIKERVGFPEDLRGFLLTKKIKRDKIHILDQYRNIVKDYVELKNYKPYIPGFKRKKTNEKIAGIDMKSAFGEARSWKKEGFFEIARYLEEKGYKILQIGKEPDNQITEKTVNLTGKTTLQDVIEIISQMSLFISVDTGSMHIASALGIPQVALYLSTSPEWTAPFYNDKLVVIKSNAECSPCFKRECRFGDYHCRDIDISIVKEKIGELIE